MNSRTCIRHPATVLHHIFPAPASVQLQTPRHRPRVPTALARVSNDQRREAGGGRGGGTSHKRSVKLGTPPRLGPVVWTLPRDNDITYAKVHMREADGTLSEPRCKSDILQKLNRARYSLAVLVMPGHDRKKNKWERQASDHEVGEGEVEGEGEGEERREVEDGVDGKKKQRVRYPICTIIDCETERAEHVRKHEEALRSWEEARQLSRRTKRLELNWAIAAHDLQYKMRFMQTFLRKGMRVEVALLDKANTRRDKKKMATRDEAKNLVALIEEAAAEVSGTKEHQPREGSSGQQLTMFFEGVKQERKEPKQGKDEHEDEHEDEVGDGDKAEVEEGRIC